METLESVLDAASAFVWGPWLLIPLLLGAGIYLTIRLQGLQLRKLGRSLRLALIGRKDESASSHGDISHYQALTTALAATVGVGNIAGVATAIYLGGPGALFWMWVTGLLGMATKYSEAFMGVRFRTKDARGNMSGGPQYYLARAIPNRFGLVLSILFAVCAVLASVGVGNMTQANTEAYSAHDSGGLPARGSGGVLVVRFRTTDARGYMFGGPQYYLARAIANRFGLVLSILFAVFAVLASFGIGNMTLANTVASSVQDSFGVPGWVSGVVMAVFAAVVLIGGIKTIGRVTAGFVPLMIVLYVVGGLLVLVLNVADLPAALALVFTDAFTGTAATGGFIGAGVAAAIQFGVARGMFSNESGL